MTTTFLLPLLAIISSLNIYYLHSPILGLASGLFFITLGSILWGKKIFKEKTCAEQIYLGFLFFLALTVVVLTTIYYFYKIDDLVISGYMLFMSFVCLLINKSKKEKPFIWSAIFPRLNFKEVLSIIVYLLILAITYFILYKGTTYEAVRTPWIYTPKIFFVFYFLSTLILIWSCRRLKTVYALILAMGHLIFSFNIANIIFPLGFGYDPFIHEATEKYIIDFGAILPKNFYYLGQYNLVVFLVKILQLPVGLINKFLLPFLAGILLPSTIYLIYKKSWAWFLFLVLPFTVFTFTTPQNLADLLLIILAFGGLKFLDAKAKLREFFWALLLSLAILMIHPLAGVAAFIFLVLIFLKNKFKKIFYYSAALILCLSYVLVFFIFGQVSTINKIAVVNNFNLINFFHNTFRFIPDLQLNTNFVHLLKTIVYFLWQPIVIAVVILGLAIYGYKKFIIDNRVNNDLRIMNYGWGGVYLLVFGILLINSFLVFSFVDFPFLIDYERGDFSWRIFNLGVYFLIPLALKGAVAFIEKIKNIKILTALIIILAGGLTVSLYFSYPRQDVYYLNRGFNTSIHDFKAVKYLEENTKVPYVVLANQQIGAAALLEFGFRYFDHQYFFYSIPTGGELYKIYAKMAYNENISYQVAKEAMDLTGVDVVYLYLPNYWFNLKKIKPQLEAVAEETLKLENGKVWVFKFARH